MISKIQSDPSLLGYGIYFLQLVLKICNLSLCRKIFKHCHFVQNFPPAPEMLSKIPSISSWVRESVSLSVRWSGSPWVSESVSPWVCQFASPSVNQSEYEILFSAVPGFRASLFMFADFKSQVCDFYTHYIRWRMIGFWKKIVLL